MSLKAELVCCLQNLNNVDYTTRINARKGDAIVEHALNLIYQIGINRTAFTDYEKNILGHLLVTAIKPIKIKIECTACAYRTRLNNLVLMKRSALQFLIDNYGPFTLGYSTLTKVLQDANIEESVEILDDLINDLCDLNDSDEGTSDSQLGSKKYRHHTLGGPTEVLIRKDCLHVAHLLKFDLF